MTNSNEFVTDLAAVREAFKDETGRDLAVSDKVLNMAIERCETWEEMEPEQTIKFLTGLEKQVADVSITDPGITLLVSKIDDQAEEEITACIDAVMKGKTTAVDVYAQFKRIYTREEMNAMPYPNTDKEHVSGNQRPDKVKTTDQTGKAITVQWTHDFVSAMGRGKEAENLIADVKKEQKAVGSIPTLKGKGKAELASILSDATARRNALRNMVKRAISLHHQWEAINAMPHLGIQFIKGKQGGTVIPNEFGEAKGKPVTGAPKPIWIYPADDAGNGRDFSVTQVLAMDPAKALNMPEGGTMAELVATAATGADTPEGTPEATVDDFTAVVPDFATILNKRENMALLLKKVAPSKDASDSEPDDLLESICSLYLNLKPIYDKNKSRYERIINRDNEEPELKTGT
jgi:hypothetical protein